ncbi:MAG: phosphate/phosphite/phosphonate ABC transporter substrate-binding protein [Reyranella sp.]|uniref:phosphate/phosphite/phosphonate ABC transporter substrate-binding protein n=1 Tax=Reyranella sp. TaxID=1929291 RepID=UPI003D1404EC
MKTRAASLPMYNLPEMRPLNAAFWDALADELRHDGFANIPSVLTFARPPVPDRIEDEVLFSQTCGYPLQTLYRGQYRLLGTPSYDAPGCREGTHCAFILVRGDSPYRKPEDLRGTSFALNSRHSNSGMNLPRLLFAPLAGGKPFFRSVVETGSHPNSIARVTSGELDSASIDCLTYTFLEDHRPEVVASLRILAETPGSPAIPFVTSIATPADEAARLQAGLLRLAADPARRPVLAGLRLRSISMPDPAAYAALLDYERKAAELGYPELA